jgi:hypothetical protein
MKNLKELVCVKKRGAKFNTELIPPVLYNQFPLPINKAKASDLQELASKYIPNPQKSFYKNLPSVDN